MASLIRVLVVLGILGFTLSAPFDEVFPLALPSDDGIPVDDEQYEEILRPVLGDKDFNYKDLSVSLTDHHCSCSSGSSFSCQCCAKVNIHILHLRMCAGFAYNPNQQALDFKVTLDGRKVYEKIVKVPVPTRFCHSINIEKHQLKLCVALTQISFKKGHTGGCFDVEVDYMFFKWKQRLGCLYRQEAVDEEEKRVGTLYFR